MKILLVNKLFYPWIGGVETVVKQLAEVVSEDASTTVDVLCAHEQKGIPTSTSKVDGYTVIKCKSFGILFSTPLSFSLLFKLRRIAAQYDVVHLHSPFPLTDLFFILFANKAKKIIVTFHADVVKTRYSKLGRYYNAVLRVLLKRSSAVIVTSEYMRKSTPVLQRLGQKVSVIPLAYDVRKPIFDIPPNDLIAKRYAGKRILFVGRLSYYKGVHILIQAIRFLECSLDIVGAGELVGELKSLVDRLDVKHKVTFHGRVDANQLESLYREAFLFVLPSVNAAEAFGIVQLEAMLYGLPVINTLLDSGVPEVSLHHVTGLTVKPEDPEDLRAAIERLSNEFDTYRIFSENSFQRGLEFSPQKMGKLHRDIYSRTL